MFDVVHVHTTSAHYLYYLIGIACAHFKHSVHETREAVQIIFRNDCKQISLLNHRYFRLCVVEFICKIFSTNSNLHVHITHVYLCVCVCVHIHVLLSGFHFYSTCSYKECY